MDEKRKCEKCNLLIDSSLDTCPFCGAKQEKKDDNLKTKEENVVKEETPNTKKWIFESMVDILPKQKNLILFLGGFILIQILSVIISLTAEAINPYYSIYSTKLHGYLNLTIYFIIFGSIILSLMDDVLTLLKKFSKGRTYLYGFCYGFILIIGTTIINVITRFIYPDLTNNVNQAGVNSVTKMMPLLSLIVFGIVGPIVEELIYRVGLFGFLKKIFKRNVFAYLIAALVFALIHFDFSSLLTGGNKLLIEFINLPSYIWGGLMLCYVYHKEGFGASTIAHCTNNLYSFFITFLIA